MHKKFLFLILLFTITFFCTCKKSDTANSAGGVTVQGNVTLALSIMHHTWGVPSIPVYIKFNTSQWPGKDTTKYDIMQRANLEGNVTFPHIGPGDLVIYAAGFDSIYQAIVIGYTTLSITKADANTTVNATVVVSEKF